MMNNRIGASIRQRLISIKQRIQFDTLRTKININRMLITISVIIMTVVIAQQFRKISNVVANLSTIQSVVVLGNKAGNEAALLTETINRVALSQNINQKDEIVALQKQLKSDRDTLKTTAYAPEIPEFLREDVSELLVFINYMLVSSDIGLKYINHQQWQPFNHRAESINNVQRYIHQTVQDFTADVDNFYVSEVEVVQSLKNTIMIHIIILALFVIAVVFAVTRYILRTVAHPIAELTTATTEFASGNLNRRVTVQASGEVGQLARAFNTMTRRLHNLFDTLEHRIQERTRALEVSMEISSQITMQQEKQSLLDYITERIQHGYKLYHTHIYLIDTKTDELVLTAGYGDMIEQMLAEGHRVKWGKGIIGTVAATNKPFLSNNVLELLNYVPHPLLPNTRSELAVPLRVGNRVVGVLDIQSDQEERFKPEDITLMQSLADQTAVALQNIQLLEEMRETLKQVERLNQRLTQSTWAEFGDEVSTTGFRYRGGRRATITPESDAWLPLMGLAANRKKLVRQRTESNGKYQRDELAVPLKLRGEIIGYLGITRDETSGWLEEEVEAVETVATQISMALENARLSHEQEKTIVRLRDVDKLKSNFLASMSHELRTPLNSIIGFADILLQGIDGELSENAITDITAIYNSGKHLLALINDILDMSKIEAGRMELARNAIEVPQLFDDVSASVSSLLKDKPVELQQHLAPDLPPIWADPLRISQVLINLVSNAIKFTEEGSVTLGAELFGNKLMHIYVSDTGIGIPKDKFDLVFEHFRQVDARSNRKYQGTGMGLAISKQLVELHGGEMWLDSEEGVGSTFHFTVPLAETAETPQPEPEPSTGETSN